MEQNKFYQITNVTEHEYTLVDCDGSVITRPIQDIDKSASIFTIQDAKDGDVLTYNNSRNNVWICIFKEYVNERIYDYCTLDKESFWECGNWNYLASFSYIPATKEQRDLLFQGMKESGYEWDAEKKELKEIIDEKQIKKNLQDNSFRRMFEQKPAWSEKDEDYINDLIKYFSQNERLKNTKEDIVIWLNSLRPQNRWKPSEEQLGALESATENCAYSEYQDCLRELLKQLNKLREE